MKSTSSRLILAAILLAVCSPFVRANDLPLVYFSSDAVRSGNFALGEVAGTMILVQVPAGTVSLKPFVGFVGQDLREASVSRIDNDLNLALLRVGAVVADDTLRAAHAQKSALVSDFVPKTTPVAPGQTPAGPIEPYSILIDDKPIGDAGATIVRGKRSASFNLTIRRESTDPVWQFTAKLSSVPDMRFWNRKKEKGLNAIPTAVLSYSYQALFRPMQQGNVVVIPIDVTKIVSDEATWTLTINTKEKTSFEVKFPVHFTTK